MEFKTSMTTSTANNPLAKHFRQPAIFLKLPSQGKFWAQGAINLTVTGEVPVYPMTVKDELLLKTPDALINGTSIAEMIRSCIPDIKDPWACPVIDLDAILIAIRLASYGTQMDFESRCPHCKNPNDHAIDLRVLLDNIQPAGYVDNTFSVNDLKFTFKPQNFAELSLITQATFEQQKLVNTVVNSTDIPDEDKAELFKDGFAKLTQINLDLVATCIDHVEVDGQTVSDKQMINDFLEQTDRQTYETIKNHIEQAVANNKLEALTLKCNHCEEEYVTALEFNQSNFFV